MVKREGIRLAHEREKFIEKCRIEDENKKALEAAKEAKRYVR